MFVEKVFYYIKMKITIYNVDSLGEHLMLGLILLAGSVAHSDAYP